MGLLNLDSFIEINTKLKGLVNRLIRRHNKSVYSSLAIRHVAEQIDSLYWDAGEATQSHPTTSVDGGISDYVLRQSDDLTQEEWVAWLN